MTRMTLTRPTEPMLPLLRPLLFPTPRFPSLFDVSDDLTARANEVIRAAFGDGTTRLVDWTPAINVSETDEEFTLTAELPGLTAKDVEIEFDNGVLTVRGEKQEEKEKQENNRKWYVWERRYGSFQRSIPFPSTVDEKRIKAEFKDGVLTVSLPKASEAKAKRRVVPIAEK